MTVDLIILVTTFLAAFIQGVSGFGFALVAMPVLSGVTSIYTAVPLVAMATLLCNTILSICYRQSCDRKAVAKLLVGSVLGIPLGFLALQYIPATWMLTALGLMITTYAVYALASPVMPVLKSPSWTYGAGFLSGILMGSYNLPGPPVVLYGNSQRWPQATFKGTLTIFFAINGVLTVLGHGLQNRISEEIFGQFLMIIPGLGLGLLLGATLAKLFNPILFRKVVIGILIVIGIRLIILGVQS